MNIWQEVYFCIQRTNLINTATIWTDLVFSNQTTNFYMLHEFQDFMDITHDMVKFFVLSVFFFVSCDDSLANGIGRIFTGQFFFNLHRFFQIVIVSCNNLSLQFRVHLKKLHICFFLTNCCNDLILEIQEFLNGCMTFQECFQHHFF